LNEAFARHYYNYDEAPLLIVNTTSIDPINNDVDYLELFEQIEQITSGRHFYNPITEVAFG
jgi:deoxyadenosine/deoxycytidine kinase